MRSLLITLLAAATGTLAAAEVTHITSATNVRLRIAAGNEAAIVQMLPLGTQLASDGPEQPDGWLPVRLAQDNAIQGWISAALVAPVTPATEREVLARLIESRLARSGDGFRARRELLDLVETSLTGEWSAEEKARLDLQRLQALQGVLASVPWRRDLWDDSLRAWIQDRQAEIRYNEPGGQWLVPHEHIFATHDANRNAAVSDEIAWLAVRIGLGGECEGHLVCYLGRLDALEIEYLRREPKGNHVEKVVAELITRVEGFITNTTGPSRYYFEPARECTELEAAIATMTAAAQASNASQSGLLVERTNSLMEQRCT